MPQPVKELQGVLVVVQLAVPKAPQEGEQGEQQQPQAIEDQAKQDQIQPVPQTAASQTTVAQYSPSSP
jgi:hypothetical protein